MEKIVAVTSWNYNAEARYLKIFYNNGKAELYRPISKLIYANLLRSHNKAAFIQKYLAYNVHFKCIATID